MLIFAKIIFMKRLIVIAAAAALMVSCGTLNTQRLLQGGAYAAQALTLPKADVQAYVSQYIAQLDAKSQVLPVSDPYSIRLAKLVGKLTNIGDQPLNYKVYRNNEVNAFACADGSVRVYTGIMDLMNDDELLTVIGHEIGHVALEHTYQQMRRSLLTSAAFEGLASTSDKVAALTDSQLGAIGQAMIDAHYSKKQETEADEFSYSFLVAAKRNPWTMVQAFEKLQTASGSAMSGPVSNLFSTHPNVATRIKNISAKCEADGYVRP